MLSQVYVEKREEIIKIEWQSAEIHIPVQEVIEIVDTPTLCINTEKFINIGIPSLGSEKVIIKTKKLCYVLFSTDKNSILNEILKLKS
ncbi:hypothetical protein ACLBXI_20720 [Bacillus cereus]